MALVTFVTIPMDNYLYCKRCRIDVGKGNDGPHLHALAKHPGVRLNRLYRPSEPRTVIADEEPLP